MNSFYLWANKFDFSIPSEKIREAIKTSDFLVSDDKCIHRLIGIKYNDFSPKITIVCTRNEMVIAKQIAFELGKKIYNNNLLSARLFYNYNKGQDICNDLNSLGSLFKIYKMWSKRSFHCQVKSWYKFLLPD